MPGGTAAREQLVSRGLEYLKRLQKDSSNDPAVQAEIAVGYRRLGDLYQFLYRPGQSTAEQRLNSYQQSIELLGKLVPAYPERVEWRVALAAAYEGKGEALMSLGQIPLSAASFATSLAAISSPATISVRSVRSEAYAVRGNALASRGILTLNKRARATLRCVTLRTALHR